MFLTLNDEQRRFIATVRELPQADRYVRAGRWPKAPYPLTQGTLRGRTLGIVGLGRIGKAIARRAEAFGLKIAYYGRHKQPDVDYPHYPSVEALAEAVDTLMIIVPGGPETRHLVDAKVLAALGPNGVLVNVERLIFGVIIIVMLIREPDGFASQLQRFIARCRVWPLRA